MQIDPRLPVIPVCARSRTRAANCSPPSSARFAQALDEGKVEMAEAQLQIEHYWAGALRRAVIDGDVEHGSVMAGTIGWDGDEGGAGRDILATLMDEAAHALEKREG